MLAVCRRYGLDPKMPASVMRADKILLATEFRDVTTMDDAEWIKTECGADPLNGFLLGWPPIVAERRFLDRFEELTA